VHAPAASASDERFRPASHIRRRPEFQRVYDSGARVNGRLMTVFILQRPDGPTRLGIAATRKLGGAVVRNRAKRLIREVFRRHRHPRGLDIVVVPRAALLTASYEAIERDYASSVDRRARRSRPSTP
jgi:ribonuclease P protein component